MITGVQFTAVIVVIARNQMRSTRWAVRSRSGTVGSASNDFILIGRRCRRRRRRPSIRSPNTNLALMTSSRHPQFLSYGCYILRVFFFTCVDWMVTSIGERLARLQ